MGEFCVNAAYMYVQYRDITYEVKSRGFISFLFFSFFPGNPYGDVYGVQH